MLDRPVLILSSWSSGSPLVAGFLGQCGGFLCPPFAKSINPEVPMTYESEMYRGLVSATVNEFSFQFKVDPIIFRNGFKSWYLQQVKEAEKVGAQSIVLNHPLSVFVLDQICEIVDPTFIVITRPFEKIEHTRAKQNLGNTYGRQGAQIIYEKSYSYLHEKEKDFLTLAFRNFAASEKSRLELVDYCGLDVSVDQARDAFTLTFPKASN